MQVTAEKPGQRPAVLALNSEAFGGPAEAALVARLDRDGVVVASLVAEEQGRVVGHILFSALSVEVEGRPVEAVSLAPMCVAPGRQGQGIGSRLVRAGVEAVRSRGAEAIIVLGHEWFYPRFGFRHDLVRNLSCAFNAYEAFMGLELKPGALGGRKGICRYPKAFDDIPEGDHGPDGSA